MVTAFLRLDEAGAKRLAWNATVCVMDALHPVELRVLGSLMEKEVTTPEYYPMTVNALVNACNQKTNRDPVVSFDEQTVTDALRLLGNRRLAYSVSGTGHRVEKYAHRIGETLNLGRRESALICVLILRGPQTPGELRGRTERMHDFNDLDEVERCLTGLIERELVTKLPLAPGMKEVRFAQLLGGPVEWTEPALVESPQRAAMEQRIAKLEGEVAELRAQFAEFRKQFE